MLLYEHEELSILPTSNTTDSNIQGMPSVMQLLPKLAQLYVIALLSCISLPCREALEFLLRANRYGICCLTSC